MNAEARTKKVVDEAKESVSDSPAKALLSNEDKLTYANQLYDKVKDLIHNSKPLDQDTAKLIIEAADDAIKEFGNTNQEKKVELKKWKADAELVLSPATIEDLRKRAEGQLVKNIYPKKSEALRKALFVVVALTIIILSVLALRQFFSEKTDAPITEPSPSPPFIQPIDKDAKNSTQSLSITPTPHKFVTATPTPTRSQRMPPFVEATPGVKAEQDFNLNSLTTYLRLKMPDREQANPANMSDLFEELSKAGYSSIFEVDRILDSASEAFKLYEKENPPGKPSSKFADAGVVRISACIADDNYLRTHINRFNDEAMAEKVFIMERKNFRKYKQLLK